MLVPTSKRSSGFLLAVVLGIASVQGRAQNAAATGGQPNWKDQAEYELYNAILKDTNPQTKLEKVNQWKDKYPSTEFIAARRTLFLTTYVQLNQVVNALNAAKEILANDPGDFTALYYVTLLTPHAPSPTADQLADAQKAANELLNGGLDKQFAPDKKPAGVTDQQWKKARTDIEAVAHTTLGWVAMQQKQNEGAEAEFQKSLAIDPNNGQVALWMGTVMAAGQKDKYPAALFYFARAAAYDGPNALAPKGRQDITDYLKKAYVKYHGSSEGFDKLLQTAKANPAPPADYKIASVVDIEKAKIEAEEKAAKENPQLALWKNIKETLLGAEGAKYFETMKDSLLPTLNGKVVSMEPATRPKTVVLAIEDGATPDATLKFETALPGKVEPGTVLTFEGVPEGYSTTAFMITFNVDAKEHLHGWTGTNPKAPVRRAPVRRKAG